MPWPPGNPDQFWKTKVEPWLYWWETRASPVRWGSLFKGREGFYVLLRAAVFAGALAVVASGSGGVTLSIIGLMFTVWSLLDIVLVHTSIAFVTRKPDNLLRTAVLSLFSFVQITMAFAVFHLSLGGFNVPLTWQSALYFSLVTATTVGYGDILPRTPGARLLTMLEIVTSLSFLAVLLARLLELRHDDLKAPGGVKAEARRDANKPPDEIR